MSEELNQQTNQQVDAEQTQNNEGKMFTQDELNGFLAKQKNDTQNKFLKQLGFESIDSAKESLTKLREFEESKKTEAEKQAELLKQHQDNLTKYQSENESLKAQLSATSQGVKADSLQDVVTLAKTFMNDETDINQAITKVLEKYPHFKGEGQQQEPGKPSFTTGQHQKTQPTEKDKWLEIFKPTK